MHTHMHVTRLRAAGNMVVSQCASECISNMTQCACVLQDGVMRVPDAHASNAACAEMRVSALGTTALSQYPVFEALERISNMIQCACVLQDGLKCCEIHMQCVTRVQVQLDIQQCINTRCSRHLSASEACYSVLVCCRTAWDAAKSICSA